MAGSSVTQTRVTNHAKVKKPPTEVVVTLLCVSDDTTGLVPSEAIAGLDEYVLTEVWPVPHGVTPFTSAFEVRLEDTTTGGRLFLSGSIAVTSKEVIAGSSGSQDGGYPRPNSSMTFKIVDPADSTTLLDVGNTKTHTIKMRFESQA